MNKCNVCGTYESNLSPYNLCFICERNSASNERQRNRNRGFVPRVPYENYPELENLRKENKELMQALKRNFQEENSEVREFRQALEQKQTEINNLDNQKRELASQNQGLKQTLEQKQTEINNLANQKRELASQKQGLKQTLSCEQNENLQLRETIARLKKKVSSQERELVEKELSNRKSELNGFLTVIKIKIKGEQQGLLDDLLEAQSELTKSNNTFIQKQLEKTKKTLIDELSQGEIETLLKKQAEITKIEMQLEQSIPSQVKSNQTSSQDRCRIM